MKAHAKYFLAGAALAGAIAVVVLFPRSGDQVETSSQPVTEEVQTAQIDPNPAPQLPDAGTGALSDEIGPEEFFGSLSVALSGQGFEEDYIAAIEALYAGFDPADFLDIEAQALAGQLAQHLQDEYGFANVTTEEAEAILELAREVHHDMNE